jgi:hypothetical protein
MKTKFLALIAAFFMLTTVAANKAKAEIITVTGANLMTSMTFYDSSGSYTAPLNPYGSYTQYVYVPDGSYNYVEIQYSSNYGSFIDYGHYRHTYTFNSNNYSESADFDTDHSSPTYGLLTFYYGVTVGSGYNTVFEYYN